MVIYSKPSNALYCLLERVLFIKPTTGFNSEKPQLERHW